MKKNDEIEILEIWKMTHDYKVKFKRGGEVLGWYVQAKDELDAYSTVMGGCVSTAGHRSSRREHRNFGWPWKDGDDS